MVMRETAVVQLQPKAVTVELLMLLLQMLHG
jgi:hypothetical protein